MMLDLLLFLFALAVVLLALSGSILVLHTATWPLRSRRRTGRQVPVSDEHLLDLSYTAGVVRVGSE